MFNLIPLEHYTSIYYYALLMIVLLMFLYTQLTVFDSKYESNKIFIKILALTTFPFVFIYMGARPLSGRYFGDMSTYNQIFEALKSFGSTALPENDVFFYQYMLATSKVVESEGFFLLTAFFYTLPLYIVSKKLFKKYWFYSFLLFVTSLSFWSYGTNGIRNGLATSIFLLVFSTRNLTLRILILLLAVNIHSSMLIPTLGYLITLIVSRTKLLLYGWCLAIPVSLVGGGFFQSLFANMYNDDRTSYLTEGNLNNDVFSSNGFRWDFVAYSAIAVIVGYYFIYRKHYTDKIYHVIYGTYLIANALWILVIKANFSNRFAYLSWFIMPLVVIYPLLNQPKTKQNHQLVGYSILLYFFFTFFMFNSSII